MISTKQAPDEGKSLVQVFPAQVTQMNGLRVYIQLVVNSPDLENKVFYSRRGAGPYYKWRFDEKLAVWCPSRVNTADLTAQMISNASWKSVPTSLQTRLGEHYIE